MDDDYDSMTRFATLATCALNQWALDFDGNLERTMESIRQAKARGARVRVGPELEITGYSCGDAFYESDTLVHAWGSLAKLLDSDVTDGCLCDIGMPVLHQGARHNCRIICLDRKILLIRPKANLADDGNYCESRWFTEWGRGFEVEAYFLPRNISLITGQVKVPIGIAMVQLADTVYACEVCEELFTASNPGIAMGLSGAEIIGNGSGSIHTLGKRKRRLELIEEQTKKNGMAYIYSNQLNGDGDRLNFDGTALICLNGKTIAIGSQFSIADVEVVCATISLLDIWNYRAGIASRAVQAAKAEKVLRIDALHFRVSVPRHRLVTPLTMGLPADCILAHREEEEVCLGPACWLWNYLRRSGMPGFFLALSGGVDSAATAAIVCVMCQIVFDHVRAGDAVTIADIQRMTRIADFVPADAKDLASKIFFCVYMATANSSADSLERARAVAADIGCRFHAMSIDGVVAAFGASFHAMTGMQPDLQKRGTQENVACQNVQARTRMVMAYQCAQLMLCAEPRNAGKTHPGTLLVLGSANLDEAYRGYFTKYDCSSADVNPIGGMGKLLLRRFLAWASDARGMPSLKRVLAAKSSAELQPVAADGTQAQLSEDEMGMTFDEIAVYRKLRVDERCGPVLMYHKLRDIWPTVEPRALAEKVKTFFRQYSINRHKVVTLTPSYHMESSGCDAARYDQRQYLFNTAWPCQFAKIDEIVREELRLADLPRHAAEAEALLMAK